MKKIFAIVILLLFSTETMCGQSLFYRSASRDIQATSVRGCVQRVFQSQIGVREATGRNDGEVEKYLNSVGFGAGYAWCGAFIHWTLDQCGVATHFEESKAYAWTPNYTQLPHYSPENYTAQPGDLILLWYDKLGRVGHVGFVDYWSKGNKAVTAEGNTNQAGSRTGDGVYVKYRLKKQIYKIVQTF